MKRYKIVRIDEADYGCEGRPDGEEAMDSVWLEDENGERQIVRASDRMLYDRHLDEGSLVTFDEKNQLTAWLSEKWLMGRL